MRVNVYAEEMSEDIEIIAKEIDGQTFTGLRLYLYLPATENGRQVRGKFMHRDGDDDSSAVTFWGKRDLRVVLRKMLDALDAHYDGDRADEGARETRWERARLELEAWQREVKPASLLELHDLDKFDALFESSDPLVANERVFRNVWWNGAPEFPADTVPLLAWHPMVHLTLPAAYLHEAVGKVMRAYGLREAFLWEDERTRWAWLSLKEPNHRLGDDDDDTDGLYRPTNVVLREVIDEADVHTSEIVSAS